MVDSSVEVAPFMNDNTGRGYAEREHREMVAAAETGDSAVLASILEGHMKRTADTVTTLLGDGTHAQDRLIPAGRPGPLRSEGEIHES